MNLQGICVGTEFPDLQKAVSVRMLPWTFTMIRELDPATAANILEKLVRKADLLVVGDPYISLLSAPEFNWSAEPHRRYAKLIFLLYQPGSEAVSLSVNWPFVISRLPFENDVQNKILEILSDQTPWFLDAKKRAECQVVSDERFASSFFLSGAQADLIITDRMSSASVMARFLAHEFNNILNGVLGYTSLIKLDMESDSILTEYVHEIETTAKRAADMTATLVGFAKPQPVFGEQFSLNDAIRQVSGELMRFASSQAEISLELDPEIPEMEGDPGQIARLINILGTNALEAIGEDGFVQFKSYRVSAGDELDDVSTKEWLGFSVSDNGTGIDASELGHVFDPFFTTKKNQKHQGLGLAIGYGLIIRHGGRWMIESEPGKGTTFSVCFPAARSGWTDSMDVADEAVTHKKSDAPCISRILLVDDDDSVRFTGQRLLERMGYLVTVAENGQQALDILTDDPTGFDLIILDMILPGLSGEEIFEIIQKRDLNIPVLLASGYNTEEKVRQMIDRGAVGFIQKPFMQESLRKKILQISG